MNLRDLPDMSAAYKQVQEKKGDGNLANNAVPYNKVTKADIITGALGRDEKGGKAKPKGHDCAKLVKYAPDGGVKEEFETIPEQHTLLEDGTVTHYDITDGEWIYENVPVEDLEIVISEKHEHFVNYDKNAEVLGEEQLDEVLDTPEKANEYARKNVRSVLGAFVKGVANKDISQMKTIEKRKRGAELGKRKAERKAAEEQNEEYVDEGLSGERYKTALKKGKMYSRMVSADPKKRATRGGRGGESDFGAGDRGSGNKAARRAGTYQEEFEAFIEEFIDFNDPELDTLTFEELELIAEEALLELDQEEGLLAEALEIIDAMTLLSEGYYDSAVASSKAAAKTPEARAGRRNLRKEKMKAAVKSAASNIKKGAEKAGSAAGTVAGKAVNAAGAAKDAVKAGASKVGSAAGKAAGAVGSAAGKAASGAKKVARGAGEVAGAAAGGFASGYAAARAKRTGSASTQSSTGSASTQSSTASKPSSSDSSSTNQSNRPRLRDRIKAGLKRAIGGAARSVSRGARNVARRMGESYSWRDAISYTQVDETSGEQE